MGSGVSTNKSNSANVNNKSKVVQSHQSTISSSNQGNVTTKFHSDTNSSSILQQSNILNINDEEYQFLVSQEPLGNETYSPRSNHSEDMANMEEMFGHTALSLGMDNEELLFNLMYFDEGQNTSFNTVMNNVQEETLALHSENNTPYKLNPASALAISGLHKEVYMPSSHSLNNKLFKDCEQQQVQQHDNDGCECSVCKDNIEFGSDILKIPSCQHYFHEECLLRWIRMVRIYI